MATDLGKLRRVGRPKGTRGIKLTKGARVWHQASKLQQREAIREVVSKHAKRMLEAQIMHSIGIWHIYTRDKTGKFSRLENEEQADKLLTEGTEGQDYWLFMKDPSTAAFADLFDRAFDTAAKPTQALDVKHDGTLVIRIEKPW